MYRRKAYPIVISKESDGFYVEIPDFDIATQGEDIAVCYGNGTRRNRIDGY